MLIVGAQNWAQRIVEILHEAGIKVLLVDSNRQHIESAQLSGLPAHHAQVLSKFDFEDLNLTGIGRMLALTANDAINSLATLYFKENFDQAEVYQLPPPEGKNHDDMVTSPYHGRLLFDQTTTYRYLDDLFHEKYQVIRTEISKEFTFDAFQEQYGGKAIPLFLIDEASGNLLVFTTDLRPTPEPGQTLVSIVAPTETESAGQNSDVNGRLKQEEELTLAD